MRRFFFSLPLNQHDASVNASTFRAANFASCFDRAPAHAAVPLALIALCSSIPVAAASTRLPEIRIHFHNRVPDCVTPDRLMAFLRTRNNRLPTRFRDIAKWYRHHGETLQVRWDYAFFQMALETNFLTYLRGNGRPGDVKPGQNNFAGLGATGGGVAGDRFPNVSTGVLAQIQHLVVYSGQTLRNPVAPRTAFAQNDIVEQSRSLKRPVRFSDLTRRWAADPRYAASIASIAGKFEQAYCNGSATNTSVSPEIPSAKLVSEHVTPSHLIGPGTYASQTTAKKIKVPQPQLAKRSASHQPQRAPTARTKLAGGLLPGLQDVARKLTSRVYPAKIVPPPPRPAKSTSQLAANN
ncbi:MAG: glucosaminidase domain-containing protein [Hyphomicrobiaceae bacterium]|nr:glucosaminidase domain-containing protein [Hyphomicrobiaceae bacterium]MCC0011069.1 glucosaminidase domain-containing protein [Hyphomicrobiaceae bacterium]